MTGETPGPAGDETTGDERVDAAVRRLAEIGGLPLEDHVARYREVHDALQDILADAEQG